MVGATRGMTDPAPGSAMPEVARSAVPAEVSAPPPSARIQ